MIGLALLAGCRDRLPLGEAPILGGTAAQRAAIAEALERFEGWVGEGRLRIAGVRVEAHPPNGAAGAYNVNTGMITLASSLPDYVIGEDLEHELCHALDHTEGLVASPSALWDGLAGAPLDDVFERLALDAKPSWKPRYRRSEAFAISCEVGPWVQEFLVHPCPGEEDGADVGAWLAGQAFAPLPAPVAPSSEVYVTLDLSPFPVDYHLQFFLDAPGILELWFDPPDATGGDEYIQAWFDLATGEQRGPPEIRGFPAEISTPAPEPPLPSYGSSGWDREALARGDGLLSAFFGYSELRELWYDGADWHRLETCPDQLPYPFQGVYDDHVEMLIMDLDLDAWTLSWGPITDAPLAD